MPNTNYQKSIKRDMVYKTLESLGIDALGLDSMDRKILETMTDKFKGGPVGLNTIASALSEEQATIEDIYEPFLIQLGFMSAQRGSACYRNAVTNILYSRNAKIKQRTMI